MDCPHCNIKNWREQVMENSLMETHIVKVNTNREDFVLVDGEVLALGELDVIKERIAEFVENGGNVNECEMATLQNLTFDVDVKRKIEIPQRNVDEEYEQLEEEFEIHLKGRKYDTAHDLNSALDIVAHLIEDDSEIDPHDDVQIIRNVTYGCSYEAEVEFKVDITLHDQEIKVPKQIQMGGIDWDSKTDMEIIQEFMKMQEVINKRNIGNQTQKPMEDF